MKTALITGITGQDGSYLSELLRWCTIAADIFFVNSDGHSGLKEKICGELNI
jgi:hypothetical protein